MQNKKLLLLNIPLAIFAFILLVSLVVTAIPQKNYSSYPRDAAAEIQEADITVNGRTFTAKLPCRVPTPEARTPVRVSFRLEDSSADFLYVKTVYCPLTISIDRNTLASIGMLVHYPSFMKDPATEVRFIPLPAASTGKTISLTYYSPHGRNSVTVSAPLVGKVGAITAALSRRLLPPFLLALFMLFIGLLLILVSTMSSLRRREIRTFFHLGMFSFITGVWSICENNMTQWFIDYPCILYILSFMALECLIIPFIRLFRNFAQKKYQTTLTVLGIATETAPLVSLLLQLLGKVPLYVSIQYFHITLPAFFSVLVFLSLLEFRKYHTSRMLKLLSQVVILLAAALVEVANYYFHFFSQNSLFFEIGITLFILYSAFLYVRYVYHLMLSQRKMETEIRLLTIESREQEKRTMMMMENSRVTRQQRHDFRHQLLVIRSMAAENRDTRLMDYIDTLIESIPSAVQSFCENPPVNAIVSYYAGACAQDGITFNAILDLPADLPGISAMELCSVFGNLLENAHEACMRMGLDGARYIHLRSRIHLGTLTIAMDNSFDGNAVRSGDIFRSSKDASLGGRFPSPHGIGISSIQATARMHGGDALFEAEDKVFHSSVYMALGGEKEK